MAIEYIIEREYVRFENGVKVIKKESEFTPEELKEIRKRNRAKFLKALGYKEIVSTEEEKNEKQQKKKTTA